jgi:hypothetical protein
MSKRKTDKQLDQLGASVNALVNLFSFELAELRADLNDLGLGLQEVRDVAAPGLSAPNRYDDEGPSEEELEEILGDLRAREAVASVALDGETQVVSAPLPNPAKPLGAWEITESGARVYSAAGHTAQQTLNSLLTAMVQGGDSEPSVLDIHVGFAGAEPGYENEGSFDGLLTVGI